MAGLTFANQVGAVRGVNQAAPGTFIPDDYIRWGQDVLFDRAGLIRRRHPFTTVDLYSSDGLKIYQPDTEGERVIGVVSTLNPKNEPRIGIVVAGGGTTRILFYDNDYRRTCFCTINTVNDDAIVFSRPALGGGAWIGTLEEYGIADGSANEHFLYYWRGGTGVGGTTISDVNFGISGSGASSTYTSAINATVSTTSTNTTVTGAFDPTILSEGMFVYRVSGGNEYYIGTVKSFSGSTITLEKNIIRSHGAQQNASTNANHLNQTIKLVNVRPYIHNHGRGLITYDGSGNDIISGSIGTEGEGHFAAAGVGDDWAVYRASDGAWIGDTVTSGTTNQTLALHSNHHTAIKMNADEYVAYRYGVTVGGYEGNNPQRRAGVFNTTYAGYQWFGNAGTPDTQNRVVFSAPHNAESVDLSQDAADSIVIPGAQQMRGMAASSAGLVVFQEDKTYLIRGNYRSNFSLEELYPEGCLSASSIVEYGGGVFWASKNGILFFDGATVRNLTETNLGVYYTDSIKSFDAIRNNIYAFLYKDYLFIHFTSFDSAYNPIRYEPLYAQDIANTPAIQGFQLQDWDPDFEQADIDPDTGNVPIYWDYLSMYESTGVNTGVTVPTWGSGYSFSQAVMNGTTTVTGLSFSGVNSFTNVPYTIDTGDITAGDIVIGDNIPGPYWPTGDPNYQADYVTVATIVGPDEVTLDTATLGTVTGTIQILPAAPDHVWSAANRVWGPLNLTEGITFGIYLPTSAISVVSNFDFRGFVKLDQAGGVKGFAGINAVNGDEYAVTKASLTSDVVTLTVPNHKLSPGQSVLVEGIDSTFNGEYTLTDTTVGTILYAKTNANVGEFTTDGTVRLDGVHAKLVDVDSMLDTKSASRISEDSELCENVAKDPRLYYRGPDFYLQTKHYSFGDPTLRKWFRQLFLNMYLIDGGVRLDVVDNEDKDRIDIQKRRQRNWTIFEEMLYSWNEVESIILPRVLSPNRSTWGNVEALNQTWYEFSDAAFERRKKKISWRYPTMGFRLYQMNRYRPYNFRESQRPHTVAIDSWSIGFKPMRQSRI